jgi:PAS domain S-box-containing protein
MSARADLPTPEQSDEGKPVAALLQSHDWTGSSLGPREDWPQGLRTLIRVILASSHPMAIAWGPEYTTIYNDAYRSILGARKHPRVLGLPMAQVFPETWSEVRPIFDTVIAEGIEVAARDQRFLIERDGKRQEGYFDFACSPIPDDAGTVRGVLVLCSETTERVLNERRLYNLFELAPALIAVLRGPEFRVEYANPASQLIVGAGDLHGQPLRTIMPDLDEDVIGILRRVYTSGEPFVGTEIPVRWSREGEPREGYFNIACQPTRDAADAVDGLTIHSVDVTMQVQARRDAEESQRRLTAILEQLPIGVLIAAAPSGQIVQGNARLETILRHPVLPSPTVAEYGEWTGFHPDGRQVRGDEWPLARAVNGETVTGLEFRYQRGDGTSTWIRINGAPIHDESGAIVAGVVAIADIAEERAAATALRESEARLQQALQAGGFGSWQFDSATGAFAVSDEGKAVFGLPIESEVAFSAFVERLLPSGRDALRQGFTRALAERRDYAADHPITLPDGTVRWVAIHGRPSFTDGGAPFAIIGTMQDVTARKETEEHLRDARRRTEAILAAAEIGTWTWDVARDAIHADRNLAAFFGVTPEQAEGGTIADYLAAIHPDDREATGAIIAEAIALGQPYEAEYRLVHNGKTRWVSARGRVEYDEAGNPRNLPGVVLDITARKEAEVELARLLTGERAARAEAEEAVRARDTFLSIAAHELRTPVTALKGTAQLLLRWQTRGQLDTERLTRNLDVLWRSADRLAELTEDLLDVSRIRTGQLTLELRPTDLNALLDEAVDRQREQTDARHYFRLDRATPLPLLPADAGRIEQVLTNLLGNAVKYSPQGGPIDIAAREHDGGALIIISDQGIGLPAGAVDAIFVPFGRAINATESSLPGMGLGLYICRTIIERHGGWIRAASAGEGEGTTLTFWLPNTAPATVEHDTADLP